MKNGWIKLHRKVSDNAFCRGNAERLGFWVGILLKANHDGATFFIGNQKIECKQGQFVTGRKHLSSESGVSEMKVERWLSVLESEQQIAQEKYSKYRLITILKWGQYQLDAHEKAQQMNNKRTTDEQQMNTNKNVKNIKNDKNNTFAQFWSVYPKKVSKAQAVKAWMKINPDEHLLNKILAAVEKAKQSDQWQKESGQFIPHPATWLNGQRWEDEVMLNPETVSKQQRERMMNELNNARQSCDVCKGRGFVDIDGKNTSRECRCQTIIKQKYDH